MNESIKNLQFVPIIKFLDILSKEGFNIGVDTHLRMARLLSFVKPDTTHEEICTMICPLIANNPLEQIQFYELYEQHGHIISEYLIETPVRQEKIEEKQTKATPATQPPNIDKYMKSTKKDFRWILGPIAAFLFLGLAVVSYQFLFPPAEEELKVVFNQKMLETNPHYQEYSQSKKDFLNVDDLTNSTQEGAVAETAKNYAVDTINKLKLPLLANSSTLTPNLLSNKVSFNIYQQKERIRFGLLVLLFGLFLGAQLLQLLRKLRLKSLQEKQETDLVEVGYTLPIELSKTQFLSFEKEFYSVMNQFRRAETKVAPKLNIRKTVEATIQNAGVIDFQYSYASKPQEYLLLIENSKMNNHLVRLFDYIYKTFVNNDIHADRYYFESLPNQCNNEQFPEGIDLYQIFQEHPKAKLLIFSEANNFINEHSGSFYKEISDLELWEDRVLLTAKDKALWASNEKVLIDKFLVVNADIEGFTSIARKDATETSENLLAKTQAAAESTPEIKIQDSRVLLSLDHHYSRPMRRWISACAVYPQLHWDLTLRLGHLLSQGEDRSLVTYENVLQLSKLEWFQTGEIPEDARKVLLSNNLDFTIEDERLVREELDKILKENAPVSTEDPAFHSYEMQLALNQLLLERDNDIRKKGLKGYHKQLKNQKTVDVVGAELLDVRTASMEVYVPPKLRNILFKEGKALMGLKNWAAASLVAFTGFCFYIPSFYHLPYENAQSIGEQTYSIQKWEDRMAFYDFAKTAYYNQGVAAYQQNDLEKAELFFNHALSFDHFVNTYRESVFDFSTTCYNALGITSYYLKKFANAANIDKFIYRSDQKSTLKTLLKYERVVPQGENIALVVKNGRYLYLDTKSGKYLHGSFDLAGNFEENGYALALDNNQYYQVHKNGLIRPYPIEPNLYEGKDFSPYGEFYEGFAAVKSKNGKFGYINKVGELVVQPIYDKALEFKNGEGTVLLGDHNKWQNIDQWGNCLSNCLEKADLNETVWVDTIITFDPETLEEKMKVTTFRFGPQTLKDDAFIPAWYDHAEDFHNDPLARVQKNSKWGYIGLDAKMKTAFKYTSTFPFQEGNAKVRIKNKYGFINCLGMEITPIIYDYASDFRNERAVVKIGMKYGYINQQGVPVTNFIYDNASVFEEKKAKVQQSGKTFYIDKTGAILEE